MKKQLKRWMALCLTLVLCAGTLPMQALAAVIAPDANGLMTITNDDGTVETVDESWETAFPYGTFALSNPELAVDEGGSVSLTVYRLGGTAGRVTAFVKYAPAVSLIDEDTPTYVYAAGWEDISLRVEDPSPLAWYQPVGKAPVSTVLAAGFAPGTDITRSTDDAVNENRQVTAYGETCYHLPGVLADSYQWQIQTTTDGEWQDVDGAIEDNFLVSNQWIWEYGYDFRCVYTVGEVTYCTNSVWGAVFVPEAAEELPAIPDDLVIPSEPTYTLIDGQGLDIYEAVSFPVTFAEGEYQKTIWFDAADDLLTEGDEFGTITIESCEGGELYQSANKSIIQIVDNEEKTGTQIDLTVTQVEFDRAKGEAALTVKRTGDLSYLVSVEYATADGTALAGTHYAATSGTLYFQGDVAEQTIRIPLISGGESDPTRYTFTLTLSNLLGGGELGLATLGVSQATVSLYSTGTTQEDSVNLATLLTGGDGEDVSATVGEAQAVSAPSDPINVQAEEQEEAPVIEAEIVYNNPLARTHTYMLGTVSFSRGYNSVDSADYPNHYWCDWEAVAGARTYNAPADWSNTMAYHSTGAWYTTFDEADVNVDHLIAANRFNGSKTDGNDATGRGLYQMILEHNSDASARLTIANGELLFDEFKTYVNYDMLTVRTLGSASDALWMRPLVGFYLSGNLNEAARIDYGAGNRVSFKEGDPDLKKITVSPRWTEAGCTWDELSSKASLGYSHGQLDITMSIMRTPWGKTSGAVTNRDVGANANAKFVMSRALLHRRSLARDLGLTIYTANDADVVKEGSPYARLDLSDAAYARTAMDLYNSGIKPVVSLVKRQSGVTPRDNKLYFGSTLSVSLASTDSYLPPNVPSDVTDYSVYLTDSAGNIKAYGVKQNDKTYYLTIMWDVKGATDMQAILKEQYTINVVMDRSQRVVVDLTPSVPRMDNDPRQINKQKVSEAVSMFLNSAESGADSNIRFKNNTVSATRPHFSTNEPATKTVGSNAYNIVDDTDMLFDLQNNDVDKVYNLYEINFGLSPDDRLLFNGKLYAGDETIYLTPGMLNQGTLRFYYYHKDYLTAASLMKTDLAYAQLYLDANGNGQIDGYFDPAQLDGTGSNAFILQQVGRDPVDQLITTISNTTLMDVDERYLEPVTVNGKKCSYYLKVFYTALPRKLMVGAGDDPSLTATVRPAFTTALTDTASLAALTPEQKAYRYLEAGRSVFTRDGTATDSATGKPIYGMEAAALTYVDIALGGDESPPVLAYSDIDPNQIVYKWEPAYRGSLLNEYTTSTAKSVRPIILENSVVGKNFAVAGATAAMNGKTAEYTYDETNLANLNGYLGSLVGATTYNMSIGVEDNTGKLDVEGVTKGNLKTHPNSEYLKDMGNNSMTEDGVDMKGSGNAYPEFNMDFDAGLGATDINVSDYFSIIIDEYEVGFAIGLPLGGYHSNGDAGAAGVGGGSSGAMYGPGEASKSNLEEMTALKDWMQGGDKRNNLTSLDDSYKAAKKDTDPKYSAKGMGIEFSFRMAMLWKYNPLDNGYYFSSMTFSIAGSLVFTYMYRLTVCPIVYAYIKLGASLEVTTGMGVSRQSKTADSVAVNLNTSLPNDSMNYGNDPLVMNAGDSVVFRTNRKAFDATFDGELMVEVSNTFANTNASSFVPISKAGNTSLRTGVLSSGGDHAMTVVLAERDGYYLNGQNDYYYVRLTATKETRLTKVIEVLDVRTLVYWTGVTINPSAFVEVGVGVGIEVAKLEAYISISIELAMTLGAYDVKTESYNGFEFDEFELDLGLSLRIVAVIIDFDFDLIRYVLTYGDLDPTGTTTTAKGWRHGYSALGGAFKGDSSVRSRSVDLELSPLVTVSLPASTVYTQQTYAPDSDVQSRAFQPSSSDVPFQLSGYGTSADAFRLVDGLVTGREYQVITVGNENYLLYTLSRGDGASAVDDPMLVLSRIKVTDVATTGVGASYGLVHPVDEANTTAYLVVDNDATGDLGFAGWVEGSVIHAAWVSYGSTTTDVGDDLMALQAQASRNTVIKTASFDTGFGQSFTQPIQTAGSGSHVYLPAGDANALFYARATHYGDGLQAAADAKYREYLEIAYAAPEGQEEVYRGIRDLRALTRQSDHALYGTAATLNLWAENGTASNATVALPAGELLGNIEFASDGTGGWLLAYTTTQTVYYDHATRMTVTGDLAGVAPDQLDEARIQRLYLRRVTVADGMVNWGAAKLLRTLLDFDRQSDLDGRYSGATQVSSYEDPTFANLRFLNAALGSALTGGEGVDNPWARQGGGLQPETFLVFDMMGSTYVMPNEDMNAVLDGNNTVNGGLGALIYPFFVPEDVDADGQQANNAATGRIDATIGADANGRLAAVYTAAVEHTSNNGLFVAWYDPNTSTWGDGRLLAMNHMQVYEDGETYGLSADQMKLAYLGLPTGNTEYDSYINDGGTPAYAKGALDRFVFSDLQIALGQVSGENNEYANLLVLTQGAFNELEPRDVGDGKTIYSTFRSAETGFYAVAFSAGQQKIDKVSLELTDYAFNTGDILQTYVSFTNVGDAAIRGSTANPITVTLNAGSNVVATWKITERILAGQTVNLMNEGDAAYTLPADLAVGDEFTLTVSEDASYIGEGAFSQTTESLLTVEERPELGFEELEIVSSSVDAQGNTHLAVRGQVSNRGSIDAQGAYLQFSYQTGVTGESDTPVYAPLDLTASNLSVSLQEVLPVQTRSGLTNAQMGILPLANMGEGAATAGVIAPNRYRTVEGTLVVPSGCYYAGDPAGDLKLRVEVFHNLGDRRDSISIDQTNFHSSNHAGEYQALNNVQTVSIGHSTWFTAPSRVVMAMGNTMRLPISMASSRGNVTSLTVTEVSDGSLNWTTSLGVLYYDTGTDTLVVAPSKEGSGYIRVADTATNSYVDMAYSVGEAAEGINIYEDNKLFTFSETGWTFVDDALPIPGAGTPVTPYRSDLAKGARDATITFQTAAASMDVYYVGAITVRSTLNGFRDPITAISANLDEPVNFQFANNPDQKVHTVTISVADNNSQLDRLVENFTANAVPTPADDAQSPQIYWSRSFPETASIQTGSAPVDMTCYVLDDGSLLSLTVNGSEPGGLTKTRDGLWQFTTSIGANGAYEVVATDTAGNSTTRTLRVDWFNTTPTIGASSFAPALTGVKVADDTGTEITTDIAGGNAYLTYTAGDTPAPTVAAYKYDDASARFGALGEETPGSGFPVYANGVYRVTATAADGSWRSVILPFDHFSTSDPAVWLYAQTGSSGKPALRYVAESTDNTTLSKVTINGADVPLTRSSQRVAGEWEVTLGGDYTLYAENSAGRSSSVLYTLRNVPITAGADAITLTQPWNQAEDNGAIAVNISRITGGTYVPSTNQGSYELALAEAVPYDRSDPAAYLTYLNNLSWGTATSYTGKTPGSYTLYIRDAQEPGNTATVLAYPITLVSEKTDYAVALTQSVQRPGSNDGIFTITARGGKSGTGIYQFALLYLGTDFDPATDSVTAPSAIPAGEWRSADEGAVKRFENLATGWYQIAVRDARLNYAGDPTFWNNAVTRAAYMTQRSGDATLSALAADGFEPYEPLSADLTEYTLMVSYSADSVTLTAQTNFDGATIRVGDLGEKALKVGENRFEILVTAEDETTTKLYTFTIYRDGPMLPSNDRQPVGGWDSIRSTLEKAEEGSTVVVDLNGSTLLPGDILDILAGRDVTLVLTMDGGISWSIHGESLTRTRYSDVDLGASLTGSLSATVVDALTGDGWSVPLTLTQEGELGFTATLRVELGASHSGRWANLYDCSGDTPVLLGSAQVDESGAAAWSVDAGGDLLIVVDDYDHSGAGWVNPFRDVSESHWFYEAVRYVNQKGLFKGVSDTSFAPNGSVTRAMIWTVLARMEGVDTSVGDTWYSAARAWAMESGVSDGTDPNGSISREQLAAMLYRYIGSPRSAGSLDDFRDAEKVHQWALEAMRWAVENGIITGKDGKLLDPLGGATRAEAAAMLMRFGA